MLLPSVQIIIDSDALYVESGHFMFMTFIDSTIMKQVTYQ